MRVRGRFVIAGVLMLCGVGALIGGAAEEVRWFMVLATVWVASVPPDGGWEG